VEQSKLNRWDSKGLVAPLAYFTTSYINLSLLYFPSLQSICVLLWYFSSSSLRVRLWSSRKCSIPSPQHAVVLWPQSLSISALLVTSQISHLWILYWTGRDKITSWVLGYLCFPSGCLQPFMFRLVQLNFHDFFAKPVSGSSRRSGNCPVRKWVLSLKVACLSSIHIDNHWANNNPRGLM